MNEAHSPAVQEVIRVGQLEKLGNRTGAITITDDGAGSPRTIPLAGKGV